MKTDLFHIQLLQEIVEQCHKLGATKCMVAGGAIRDMLLEKPINDIDVFYEGTLADPLQVFHEPKEETFYKNAKRKKFVSWGEPVDPVPSESLFEGDPPVEFYPDSDWKVTKQKVFYKDCKFPIQLIQCKNFDTHLETFGAALSRVYVDRNGVHLTNDFLRAVELKMCLFEEECSMGYMMKIIKKFPEYEAV